MPNGFTTLMEPRITPSNNTLFALFLALCSPFLGYAQDPGEQVPFDAWVDHLPYNKIHATAAIGNTVFAAANKGMVVYDDKSKEVQYYSTINGLSNVGITAIASDPMRNRVYLGYNNGAVDVWTPNGFHRFNAIAEATQYTGLQKINRIRLYGNALYFCTDFGVVEVDAATELVTQTFIVGNGITNPGVVDIAPHEDSLYLAMKDGGLKAAHKDDPLFYFASWNYINTTETFKFLVRNEALGLVAVMEDSSGEDSLFTYSSGTWIPHPNQFLGEILDLQLSTGIRDQIVCTNTYSVVVYGAQGVTHTLTAGVFSPGIFQPLCASYVPASDNLFVGNNGTGLIRSTDIVNNARIKPSGPHSSSAFSLYSFGPGRNNNPAPTGGSNPYAAAYRGNYGGVWVASGSLDELWVGSYNRNGAFLYQGQQWSKHSGDELLYTADIIDVAVDPLDTGRIFFCAWGNGIVEMNAGQVDELWNTANTNGALLGVGGNPMDLRVGGIDFDNSGNLWGTQSLVSQTLWKMDTDGNFSNFALSTGSDAVALKKILWHPSNLLFVQSRTNGIYVFSPDDSGQHFKTRLTTGAGNGDLPSNHVLDMAIDLDNELWIGTEDGLVVLYSPHLMLDGGSKDARAILFEEDGVVQKLLSETPVTTICVDGANQKWVGTENNGIFLFSDDGLQTLHHFTIDNSPLLSNHILDAAVDPTTGEVLIATPEGIVGFRGNATPGYTGSAPELHVYPNPVRPGYNGPVFIQGCPENARVKILDIAGNLVFEGVASGGQLRWDGVNNDGERVASGVYTAYVTTELGEKPAVAKILIVR